MGKEKGRASRLARGEHARKRKGRRGREGRHANANVNVEERRYGKCGYAECMAAN